MKKLILLNLILFNFGRVAFAVGSGGYENQVPHANAMGRANSVVASVDDPSAVFFNPARLTSLDGTNISVGGTYQTVKSEFTSQNSQSESATFGPTVAPNFYLTSTPKQLPVSFGIGVNVPYGLSSEWSDNGPLRYITTQTELTVMAISPAIGYKITDKISVGASADFYDVSKVSAEKKVDVDAINQGLTASSDPTTPEGTTKLEGDGHDIGFTLAAAYQPTEKSKLGLCYKSGANVPVEGTVKLSGLSGLSLDTFGPNYSAHVESTIVIPSSLQLGYAYQVTEKLNLELDGQWDKWSSYRKQTLQIDEADPTRSFFLNIDNPTNKDWKNSWAFGLGGNLALTQATQIRFGYGFIDSPVPNSTFEASTPDSDMHMLTAGYGYKFKNFTVDTAVQVFLLNDRHINNDVGAGTGNGDYKTSAYYFGLNLGYKI